MNPCFNPGQQDISKERDSNLTILFKLRALNKVKNTLENCVLLAAITIAKIYRRLGSVYSAGFSPRH
jgi:hypothetical protein